MASCKFEGGKYKGATEVKAHFRHNDISPVRRAIAKKKNKHIDLNKCKYNFSILGLSYEQRCKKYDNRIAYLDKNGNTNKRKDRVTAQCLEIPVPKDLPRDRYHDWFFRIADMLRAKYGEDNFIDGDIHYDEEHPYIDSETGEEVVSRVHAHFMIVPEVGGTLNCKKMTLRKNMKALNREVDAMTKSEFGCAFMTGTKKKSYKTVEELKQESEYLELLHQIEQEREELHALQTALNVHKAALETKDKELQEKEEKLLKRDKELSLWAGLIDVQNQDNIKDLEAQKKAIEQEREEIRQKEIKLDEAIKAVSEMPTPDALVEKVLDCAYVKYRSHPEAPTFDFTARRYLEYLQESQKQETEQIFKTVRRTIPDYMFVDTQQTQEQDSLEF